MVIIGLRAFLSLYFVLTFFFLEIYFSFNRLYILKGIHCGVIPELTVKRNSLLENDTAAEFNSLEGDNLDNSYDQKVFFYLNKKKLLIVYVAHSLKIVFKLHDEAQSKMDAL